MDGQTDGKTRNTAYKCERHRAHAACACMTMMTLYYRQCKSELLIAIHITVNDCPARRTAASHVGKRPTSMLIITIIISNVWIILLQNCIKINYIMY